LARARAPIARERGAVQGHQGAHDCSVAPWNTRVLADGLVSSIKDSIFLAILVLVIIVLVIVVIVLVFFIFPIFLFLLFISRGLGT